MNGVGQAFLVAGGVQVLTGCSFTYFTVSAFFSGTGETTVLGGAQIAVGVSLFDTYTMLASFGAGLDYCVCAGLMVHIGAAINEYSGPIAASMMGGYTYLGTGTYVGIGSPAISTVTTIQEAGVVSTGWEKMSKGVMSMLTSGCSYCAGNFILLPLLVIFIPSLFPSLPSPSFF